MKPPRAYPAFVAVGDYGGVGRPWSSAKAAKNNGSTGKNFNLSFYGDLTA